MSEAEIGGRACGETRDENGNADALGATDWICLAADADFRHHGAADGCSRRRLAGHGVFGRSCLAARRNGPDVPADERLPFGALAEADLEPTKRRSPVLIRRSNWTRPGYIQLKETIRE